VSYADSVKFLVAMIIMMNPLGSLSIFLQLTKHNAIKRQRKIALKSFLTIIIIMIISIWIGSRVLDWLGITIPSFRFAGGIILLLMGLAMLQSHESNVSHTHADDTAAEERDSIAVVPLAMPVIIGPGAISTLIIASTDSAGWYDRVWLSVLCLILGVAMGLMLYYARNISDAVGDSVMKVITRIMGMLIMAIAAGMLATGLIGLIPILGK